MDVGRQQACRVLVCQHYKAVYRFMAYLTRDANLAEDLTQETFASAWAHIEHYQGRASLGTWLHRIAYRKFIDSRRKQRRRAALKTRLKQEPHHGSETLNPLYRLAADEHSRLLYEAMLELKSFEYIVIVLHYIQGLSFCEMAQVLEQPVGTVKWRTSQALKRLKALLTGRAEP